MVPLLFCLLMTASTVSSRKKLDNFKKSKENKDSSCNKETFGKFKHTYVSDNGIACCTKAGVKAFTIQSKQSSCCLASGSQCIIGGMPCCNGLSCVSSGKVFANCLASVATVLLDSQRFL